MKNIHKTIFLILFGLITISSGISLGKNAADINHYQSHLGFSFDYRYENPFIDLREGYDFDSGCSTVTFSNYIGTVIKITVFDLEKNKSKYGGSDFYKPLKDHADSEFKKFSDVPMEKGGGFKKTSFKGNTAYSYSIFSMQGERRVIFIEKDKIRFILEINNTFTDALKTIEGTFKFH